MSRFAHAHYSNFVCTMASFVAVSEKENLAPDAKQSGLSLKLKKHRTIDADKSYKDRFAVASSKDIQESKKRIVPKNTSKSTNWAVRLFESWCKQRNERSVENKVPENILLSDDHGTLCHWLCTSLIELHKEDGGEYTPRSLAQYIAGLQRYITNEKGCTIKLADPTNPSFQPLRQALDNRFRELHSHGVGNSRKQAEIITRDEEQ